MNNTKDIITSEGGHHQQSEKQTGDARDQPITHRNLTFETEASFPSSNDDEEQSHSGRLISPYDWSPVYKMFITGVSCISTLFASYAASCYSPGANQMASEWQVSEVPILVGITTFTSGFAVGPMFLAPFSEIYGRKPIFTATAVLFAVCQVCCSVTRSFSGFFAGVGGSTFSTMVGGIVADIYRAEDRNTPMALFSWAALFGTGLGPLVSGFIGQYTTWRWIFYVQIIIAGLICGAVILFFQETRSSVVLRKKAMLLNKRYEELESKGHYGILVPQNESGLSNKAQVLLRVRWKIAADEERADILTMLQTSLFRPFKMVITEPVVFIFSLWAAFSWSVLYINLSVIPLVFQSQYSFSLSKSNAIFTATCVGTTLALLLSICQEHLASRSKTWNSVPEHRLFFSCVESLLLPIGLFVFGWTAHHGIHWVVPAIAVGISTMGIFAIYLAVFNYLADSYHRYASSALAAQSFCRNMLGGVFPLVSKQLFNNLTFGPAASLLGAIGAALTLVPWVLVWYGPQIRRKSNLAREIAS